MVSTKLSVLLVSLFLVAGLGMYIFSSEDDFLTGDVITATSGRQCDDTDNNSPSTGPRAEQEGTDSIWARGGVKTRVNTRARWSSIDYDSCVGSTLRERYCDSRGMKVTEEVICDYGCSTGKCNVPSCSDPDGLDYGVRSTTTGFLRTYRPLGVPPDQSFQSYTDTCSSDYVLKEYKCQSATEVMEKRQTCSDLGSGLVCRDGACVAPRPTTETICDGLDDNGNGQIDEGCDDDDDDSCDSSMTRASPYSCSNLYSLPGSNCCRHAGDCDDTNSRLSSILPEADWYPGVCNDHLDNNCNGIVDDPMTCAERDCNNLDEDGDGITDDGCDEDGDDYCDSRLLLMGINSTIAPSILPAVCPNGGGDCFDGGESMDYLGRSPFYTHPGALITCFDFFGGGYSDINCDGIVERSPSACGSYTCTDNNDLDDDPLVGGTVTIRAANGDARILTDRCIGTHSIRQINCFLHSTNNTATTTSVTQPCPSGTTCSHPEGLNGPIPAVCA